MQEVGDEVKAKEADDSEGDADASPVRFVVINELPPTILSSRMAQDRWRKTSLINILSSRKR